MNIMKNKYCYGCGVCAIVCPKQIINLELNENGFYKPVVKNTSRCIDCGLCTKVCSFDNRELASKPSEFQTYAAWTNDDDTRLKSSSGGVAFEIAKYFMSKGYKFCGVRYNAKKKIAEHYIADCVELCTASFGSKYIQSFTLDAFLQIDVKQKYVVVGTPCQMDSLRKYLQLKNAENNFILVDFFCHGVPSIRMFHNYLRNKERCLGTIGDVRWRDKETGWHDSWVMCFETPQKRIVKSRRSQRDIFYEMFLGNYCLGPQCYDDCKYKLKKSSADIRLGDLWGNEYEGFEKGVSAVVAMTKKGENVISELKNCSIYKVDGSVILNSQMKETPRKPFGYGLIRFLLNRNINVRYLLFLAKCLNKIYRGLR